MAQSRRTDRFPPTSPFIFPWEALPDAILAQRRAPWKPKPPEYTKGVMRCFSQLAASPMKGAYLDYDAD